jgi:hypothetical protein
LGGTVHVVGSAPTAKWLVRGTGIDADQTHDREGPRDQFEVTVRVN